jgi:hypothetical protein
VSARPEPALPHLSERTGPHLPTGPGPRPLTVTGLLLLDPHGHDPTPVESMTFDDGGIGVIRTRGQVARVLPWESVVSHAVEPWAGGVIPEWWVVPESPDTGPPSPGDAEVAGTLLADARRTDRSLPHAEAGAMIGIQTRSGTYRFLKPGGDPGALAPRVAAFTMHHQGAAGVSTVTTVVPGRRGQRSGWARVRPWLVVLLVAVVAAAVTVILLQSAGVIHLPYLGGDSTGRIGLARPPGGTGT